MIRDEATIKGETGKEVFRDLYEYYDRRIQELNQTITDLQVELARYKSAEDSLTKTAAPAPADSLQ